MLLCRFESSEMLSSFLASTPLLTESWRLCCYLAAPGTTSFVADHIGHSASCVAFSGLGIAPGIIGHSYGNLAPLETFANGIFSGLRRDQADPPMVHAGFLHLFLSLYNDPNFQTQVSFTSVFFFFTVRLSIFGNKLFFPFPIYSMNKRIIYSFW